MTEKILAAMSVLMLAAVAVATEHTTPDARPRASGLGLKVGIMPS